MTETKRERMNNRKKKMRGSANNKKETMRLWRENGCWSNDAGITSSLLSLLLPLCLLSLSCSPSVFSSALLHISVFLCPALIFQVISSSATQQRQGQVKNHSETIFFSFSFISLERIPQRKSFWFTSSNESEEPADQNATERAAERQSRC